MEAIGFNKPYLTGKEVHYIYQSVYSKKLSGNGAFTKKCHDFFQDNYNFRKCLLTTSCTDALEMAALLLNVKEGDEIIMPSYTFVSTANAFILRGANVVFADSYPDHPNIDPNKLEELITKRTKAIIVVHYAGIACDMDKILKIANQYGLFIVEDAAQAIDSYYLDKPLGGLGHLSAFSFHETKNIISGEGGMLVINDERLTERAEIIWEKGTNRASFFRGEVDKYGWVDIGSSFLPSEIIASFLYAQLESINLIQTQRKLLWYRYFKKLKDLQTNGKVLLPAIPEYSTNNAHIFYLICKNLEERTRLIIYLKENGISAVFHYLPLHLSTYFEGNHDSRILPNSKMFSDCLVRLPLYFELEEQQQEYICEKIKTFFYD